jgi:hypothetical protein
MLSIILKKPINGGIPAKENIKNKNTNAKTKLLIDKDFKEEIKIG